MHMAAFLLLAAHNNLLDEAEVDVDVDVDISAIVDELSEWFSTSVGSESLE